MTQQFNTTTSMGRLTLNACCPLRSSSARSLASASATRSAACRRPHHQRCGTGIWPDRDITAFRPDVPAPRVSLPTQAARPGPDNRGKPRLLDLERQIPARDRFAPDLYGAFPVKRLLLGLAHSSLFGAGKAVLHPVACDPVPGARGRGQGTETLAELGGLPP